MRVLLFTLLSVATLLGQEARLWWSLRPLVAPAVPSLRGAARTWARNEIDAFVSRELEANGLSPSGPADPRTLLRRVFFDVTGLPPSPEDVRSFLEDPSDQAYARVVDRLLASPRYGERFGRHWLDVVHYGDTHGFDKDKPRKNAWPYRDWVIAALNQDLPWSHFVSKQLAGDVGSQDDPTGIVATGFLVAGPWDFVGHVELREGTVDKAITRNLDRDDILMNVMSAFTSLTVHCARCHDHKFDPVTQKDYYALQSVFAGVERADRRYDLDPSVARRRRELDAQEARLKAELAAMDRGREALLVPSSGEWIAAKALLEEEPIALSTSETNGFHSEVMAVADATKWVQVDLGRVMPIEEVALLPARPTDYPDTAGFGFPLRYQIAVSENVEFLGARILADRTERDEESPLDQTVVVPAKTSARYVRVTATKLWKRKKDYVFALAELEVRSGGRVVSGGSTVTASDSIEEGRWSKRFLVDGRDSRHRLDGEGGARRRRNRQAHVARLAERVLKERENHEPGAARARRVALLEELRSSATERSKLPERAWVYAAASDFVRNGSFTPPPGGKPRPVFVLSRGEVTAPREAVLPSAPSGVPFEGSAFVLENPHEEGERRAALAAWIVARENPLTWRSIVNRMWGYHFGQALVSTPNDFGRMGGRPTNPELLDWMAVRFRDGGGSLKELHRLILLSATYRQSSALDEPNARIDGGNRFFWRQNKRRLEAEAVRDTILAVSGNLDLTMGGPGFRGFAFEDDHSPRYDYGQGVVSPETWRRTVYRFAVRSAPDPFLEVLDCPDPSQSAPRRNETLTALQALALLNNPFMADQSRRFAERLEREATTTEERIDRAFLLALSREANDDERRVLATYVQAHGWAAMCRLVFNLNEFLFLD